MKTIIKQEEIKNLGQAAQLNSFTKEQIADIVILSAIESGAQDTYEIQKFIQTTHGGKIYRTFLNSKQVFDAKFFEKENFADRYVQRTILEMLKKAGEEVTYKNGCTIDSESYERSVKSANDMTLNDISAMILRSHALYQYDSEFVAGSELFRNNEYFNMNGEKQQISLTRRKGQHDLCFKKFMGEFYKALEKMQSFLSVMDLNKSLYADLLNSNISSENPTGKKIHLKLSATTMTKDSFRKLKAQNNVMQNNELKIGDVIVIGQKAVFKIMGHNGKIILLDIFKKRFLCSTKFNDILELKIYLSVIEKLSEEISAKMNIEKKPEDHISAVTGNKFTLKHVG